MLRKYILLSLVILSTHSFAQTKVTAGIMQGKEYGVTYTLPKSKIQLQITASKVDYHPGEFAKYIPTPRGHFTSSIYTLEVRQDINIFYWCS